ncbi:MAG TPA: LssY C-terminal domain-containing protein [Bryobacteraceae bacterium]|nr:LssY C-terminal domain-containing protein [Bryobacteraceae bacterium]
MRCCALWLAMLPAIAAAQTIVVDARLLAPVSSYRTRSGAEIAAQITTPLCLADGARLPDDVTLSGAVTHVHKVGLGLVHESAGLRLEFRQLILANGRSFPVEARLADIENARERVDKHGAVHGIRATASLSNRAAQRLVFAAAGHPFLMVPLFAAETAALRFPDPEIDYGPGTEIRVSIRFPQELGHVSECPAGASLAAGQLAALTSLVAGLPAWSYSAGQPQDPITLVYVGTSEEIAAAFAAAGWTGSLGHNAATRWHVIRAIAEDRAYPDAPMRTLLLEGSEADFGFQKALDTFEKRDHLRVWRRPQQDFDGRPVWASAATRDVAATFSMRPFGFAHRIENDVDLERDKVVHDLKFTGCVDAVQYAARPAAALYGPDARQGLESDGRVAVVFLNSCREPRLAIADRRSGPAPPLAVRCVRRVTLTARNHFLRDNIVWRSAEAGRIGFDLLRAWLADRKAEKKSRALYAQISAAAPSP